MLMYRMNKGVVVMVVMMINGIYQLFLFPKVIHFFQCFIFVIII